MKKITILTAFLGLIIFAASSQAAIEVSKPTVEGAYVYFDVSSNLKFKGQGSQNLVVTLSTSTNAYSAIPLRGAAIAKRKTIPSQCEGCQGEVVGADRTSQFGSASYRQRKTERLVISIADLCSAGGVQTDSLCLSYLNPKTSAATLTKTLYVTIGLAADHQSIGPINGANGSDTAQVTLTLTRGFRN